MSAEATIEVLLTEPIATINPNLYGHFAEHLGTCIYGGFCAGDYADAAQLLDSQFESVAAQPERTVALFHSLVETGQADKIAKIVDVLKLHTNDQSWAGTASRCTQLAITSGDLQTA